MALAEEISRHDPLASVERLKPLILEWASDAEEQRRLAPPVTEALREAGLFRMLRPRSRGGLELDPVAEFRVAEALAGVDSGAAWNVQVSNASELFGAWFPDQSSKEVFGDPKSIVAGSFNPHRRAVEVDGGYRITGRSTFNSNCHGATWLIGLADVFDGETTRMDAAGQPETLLTLIPSSEWEILDNWNTMGLSGTGSHDVSIVDAFVPSERAVPFLPLESPAAEAYATPASRMAVWITVGCHASVALGIAQAAVDDLRELGSRVPTYADSPIRDRNRVQLRLARAEGKLAAARMFFHEAYDAAFGAIGSSGHLDLDEKARCQLASSHVVIAAVEAVDLVHSCVGTAGIREEQPFQRYFRDIHVISQHAFVGEARFESVGQVLFGLEPDWGFFAF